MGWYFAIAIALAAPTVIADVLLRTQGALTVALVFVTMCGIPLAEMVL